MNTSSTNNLVQNLTLDFSQKNILIINGVNGIGLETGLAFGRYGAQCMLTYSDNKEKDQQFIYDRFAAINAPLPVLVYAEVDNQKDTQKLVDQLSKQFNSIDVFIHYVTPKYFIRSFAEYKVEDLEKSISYFAWSMIAYVQAIERTFNQIPRYIIDVSPTTSDHSTSGCDFITASKAAIEAMCRYLAYRFRHQSSIINTLCFPATETESPEGASKDTEVANLIIGLCSGYCDIITGQSIVIK